MIVESGMADPCTGFENRRVFGAHRLRHGPFLFANGVLKIAGRFDNAVVDLRPVETKASDAVAWQQSDHQSGPEHRDAFMRARVDSRARNVETNFARVKACWQPLRTNSAGEFVVERVEPPALGLKIRPRKSGIQARQQRFARDRGWLERRL